MKRIATLALTMTASALFANHTNAASVILNEYNAVGSDKHLDENAYGDSDKADSRLGRIQGNGGNWIELVVVGDGTQGSAVDMRNWSIDWEETGDAGTIFLSNDSFWSSVTAGTLITITETQTIVSEGGQTIVNGSDTSIDFTNGDNWANVWSFDTNLISSTTTNVGGDGSGNFSVGNDDWNMTLRDGSNNVVFGPIGEGIPSSTGINSNEVFKLEAQPTTSITETSAGEGTGYNDGSSSTFGAPNLWNGGDSSQDFTSFGVITNVPEPTTCALMITGATLVAGRRRVSK